MNNYKPLSLNTTNPHYFSFRNKPEILITSCEHYGAVMNLDFNYEVYLDELQNCGLNATRLFSGYYHEIAGVFGIEGNTLGPDRDSYISPWQRTAIPGALDGGCKYDLNQFNEKYFARLIDFCKKASERGIIVEFTIFCPFYTIAFYEKQWEMCPLHSGNNINGVEELKAVDLHNKNNPVLLKYQEELVKKIVSELNDFDNIYFEICNEPYFDDVTLEWQYHIVELIVETEKSLENSHLIGQNVMTGYELIENPHKDISIFSFHYNDKDSILSNYHLNKPIGCNETGFAGSDATFYRQKAWETFMSGGSTFYNLDYSFIAGYEDGSFDSRNQPGTGSRLFRLQLKALKDFLYKLDFLQMKPDITFIKKIFFGNGSFYSMAQKNEAYAVYVFGCEIRSLELNIPEGEYDVEWLNPITMEKELTRIQTAPEGHILLHTPGFISVNGMENYKEAAVSLVRINK